MDFFRKKNTILLLALFPVLLIVGYWGYAVSNRSLQNSGFTRSNEQMQALLDQQTTTQDLTKENNTADKAKDTSVTPTNHGQPSGGNTSASSATPYQNVKSESVPKVNLNSATLEQLVELPGIGESKAAAILAYRKEKGRFSKVEELQEVKGIGPKMLDKLHPYIYISYP